MSDDGKTLWVGNLDEQVKEELLYELFLQTGPIERLILPTEGEGDSKKHKGHAYIVFHHPESVQYASQVLEGSSLFGHPLALKARTLPPIYKSVTPASGRGRSDGTTYKPGFNKATTWHGQNDFSSRGRGNFRGRGGGVSNYTQNTGYNSGFSNYNNQANTGFWMGGQQATSDTPATSFSTSENNSLEEKRQRLLQQQQITLEAHRQQQGAMNMAPQMYGMGQQQQQPQQQQQTQQQQPQQPQQQQGMWANNGYNTANWNMAGGDTSTYQGYTTDQYGNWYQQQ